MVMRRNMRHDEMNRLSETTPRKTEFKAVFWKIESRLRRRLHPLSLRRAFTERTDLRSCHSSRFELDPLIQCSRFVGR
jgi:hypothetical protein